MNGKMLTSEQRIGIAIAEGGLLKNPDSLTLSQIETLCAVELEDERTTNLNSIFVAFLIGLLLGGFFMFTMYA